MPPTQEIVLENCDATTDWNSVADRDNTTLGVDTSTKKTGTGSIKLGVNVSASSDNDWAEYNFIKSATDTLKYDYMRLWLYIKDAATLAKISHFFFDYVCDATYNNYYNFRIEANELSAGWNNVYLYFNQATATFGNPNKATFQKCTVHIHHLGENITAGDILVDDFVAGQTVETQYDIKLDNQGYMIIPDADVGYNQTDLPYAIDRFATGDIEYSDWNFYQYKTQTDWSGGFNHKFYTDDQPNVWKDGDFVDNSELGELRMSPKRVHVTAAGNTGAITCIRSFEGTAFVGVEGGNNSAYLYAWDGSSNTLDEVAQLTGCSRVFDMETYNSDLYISTTSNGKLWNYDGSTLSAISKSARYMEVLGDNLYINFEDNMYSWDDSSFTTEYTHTDWRLQDMVAWRDKLYYIATDQTQASYNSTRSALFYFDGVDRVQLGTFDEAAKSHIEYWNNKLWFLIGGILYSYDGTDIISELDILDDYNRNSLGVFMESDASHSFGRGIRSMGDKLFCFLTEATNTGMNVLMDAGFGWAPHLGDHTAKYTSMGILDGFGGTSNDVLMLGDENGNLFYLDSDAYDTDATTYVESAWIDMDLFSVEKMYRSLGFYCESLPKGSTVHMYYKIDADTDWSSLTSTNITGKTFVEATFPDNTKGRKIKYKIEISNSIGTTTPQVTDVSIKYIIAPDTKRRWTLGVILADNIIRLDSTQEPLDARELKSTLWDTRAKKEVLEFIDNDGSVYDVIMNDLQIKGPIQLKDRIGDGPEYHAFIELIEE